MGIGAIAIQTSQKDDNGAPFPAGSAANGVSVDPVTGQIVLGNDVGGTAAALTSVREIPFAGQGVILQGNGNVRTSFIPREIRVESNTAQTVINDDGYLNSRTAGPSIVTLDDGVALVSQGMDSTGVFTYVSNLSGQFGSFDVANGNWQVGLNPGGSGTFNGAKLEVVGNLTYDIFLNNNGGAVLLDEQNDKGKLFTNQGGVSTFTLPTSNPSNAGLHFMFAVQQAVNLIVQAGADSININGVVSVAGGTATANTVGSTLHLVALGTNQWMALSSQGLWVVV